MVSMAETVVKWEQEASIPVHSNILQCENKGSLYASRNRWETDIITGFIKSSTLFLEFF